jgi:hypothetical protein
VNAGGWRPLGFVLLMLGFGLRLDSDWQGLAWLLLVAGAVAGGAGLLGLRRPPDREHAFVPPAGER